MNILIATGASGGHIYPVVAVADYLKEKNRIFFVGGIRGMEDKIIPEKGYDLFRVNSYPWVGRSLIEKLRAVVQTILGTLKVIRLINKVEADFVLSSGSYSSVPTLLAAKIKKLPMFMIEVDIKPGFTTRIFQRSALIIFTAFEETKKYLKPGVKTEYLGTPLRAGFGEISKEAARKILKIPEGFKVVFIFGGSQGSEVLEKKYCRMMMKYKAYKHIFTIAASGKFSNGDYKKIQKSYPDRFLVREYIDNIHIVYSASDIVISRAGALTIAELRASCRPAILIPIPHARGHQKYNAEILLKKGAALIIEEKDLNSDVLFHSLENTLFNTTEFQKMNKNMKSVSFDNSAEKIACMLTDFRRSA